MIHLAAADETPSCTGLSQFLHRMVFLSTRDSLERALSFTEFPVNSNLNKLKS